MAKAKKWTIFISAFVKRFDVVSVKLDLCVSAGNAAPLTLANVRNVMQKRSARAIRPLLFAFA
jgi:hypothetical protein